MDSEIRLTASSASSPSSPMKSVRAITIGVTFIAGLYFILDFVVPPTLPIASIQGVVAGTNPASFSVRTGSFQPILYQLSGPESLRPQILVEQRDIFGMPKTVPSPLRQ